MRAETVSAGAMAGAAVDTMSPMADQPRTCGGCDTEIRRGQPTFFYDDVAYHVTCVPAERSSNAQSLMGIKGC